MLTEGYEFNLREDGVAFRVRANVSAQKLDGVFRTALKSLPEPLGLVLEAPCNEVRELELRKRPDAPFHSDVYYLDSLDHRRVLEIYDHYAELLIHDGFIRYGAGAHKTNHEVFVGSYKIVHFFGPMPNPFEATLTEFDIPQTEHLVTAWDTFTQDAPGQKSRYYMGDADIYGMIEELMRKDGLYHAKTIEG
jgi:hypothetical protein